MRAQICIFAIFSLALFVAEAYFFTNPPCVKTVEAYRQKARKCFSNANLQPGMPSSYIVCRRFRQAEPCMKDLHAGCSSLRKFAGTPEYQTRERLRKVC